MEIQINKDSDFAKANLGISDFVNFSGVIAEKLPNTEFIVELTHLPNGIKVDQKVLITAKLTGKIRDRRIKIAVHDGVTIQMSMETARERKGFIIYRDRGKAPIVQGKPAKKKPGGHTHQSSSK